MPQNSGSVYSGPCAGLGLVGTGPIAVLPVWAVLASHPQLGLWPGHGMPPRQLALLLDIYGDVGGGVYVLGYHRPLHRNRGHHPICGLAMLGIARWEAAQAPDVGHQVRGWPHAEPPQPNETACPKTQSGGRVGGSLSETAMDCSSGGGVCAAALCHLRPIFEANLAGETAIAGSSLFKRDYWSLVSPARLELRCLPI